MFARDVLFCLQAEKGRTRKRKKARRQKKKQHISLKNDKIFHFMSLTIECEIYNSVKKISRNLFFAGSKYIHGLLFQTG